MHRDQPLCFADPYCANILPGALGRSTTTEPSPNDYNGSAGPVTIAIPNALCFVLLFWAIVLVVAVLGRRIKSLRLFGLLVVGTWGLLTTALRLLGLIGRGEPRPNVAGLVTVVIFGFTGIGMAAAVYMAYRWSAERDRSVPRGGK